MRIVMLCRLYAPHIGGVEKHVESISKEAIKEGHRVDIFTLTQEETEVRPRQGRTSIKSGIHVHRKPKQLHSRVLRNILRLFRPLTSLFLGGEKAKRIEGGIVERDEIWGWMLWNLPTFLRADIIHIHDVFFWYWPIRFLLPWKKVFITFHGFEAGTLPTKSAKRARLRAARWTRGNIAVGGWIEKWYGTKADIVTYGAGACVSPETHRSSHNKQARLVDALFMGRLSPDTGIQTYAEVISKLKNFQLDIVGEGELKPWARKFAKETKNITVYGTVEDSCAVFPRYDVACVSSYLSILEAMQSKVLVVAFATDELKLDYLKSHPRADSMIIVERKDQLESFLKTFSPKSYQKEVERAYEWAKEQTWTKVYRQYTGLWKK